MTDKIAIIDCGTNTFHLLIAAYDGTKLSILHREKVAVRIGKGGISNNIMLPDAIDRAINTIGGFKATIDQQQISRVYAFATSAFRNATNGEAARSAILEKTGIDIRIISGLQEAELIFWGVNAALDVGPGPALIMDIGGGSVEFIIGKKDTILWAQSFEIGAQRLLDRFHKSDPIREEELQQLMNYLGENLTELLHQINQYQPHTLVGSSGTFDTLSDIYCEEHNIIKEPNATEVPLTIDGYYDIHQELISKTREERMAIRGMVEMRVDMIVVASGIIHFLLSAHNFQQIRVSTQALKEGVLDRILKGHF